MAKRRRSLSLSFVLLRFVIVLIGCMLLSCLVWFFMIRQLQSGGMIYPGYAANQQVEQMLAAKPEIFVSPGDDFLSEYALFAPNGEVLEANVEGKKRQDLAGFWQTNTDDIHVSRHTYANGDTIIIRWYYRSEFVNPVLRHMLPPFEYLWWGTLGAAMILCLLLNTLRLRRYLAARLKLFSEVSEKVGAQQLDFSIPHAGIREYDQALAAMDHMKAALYQALSSQWTARQEREAEIAALAHDLKTPLTLVGGNAELLSEEKLSESSQKMVKTIITSNNRAKQYVSSLLETAAGMDEVFENASRPALFDALCQNAKSMAEAKQVSLQSQNTLTGTASMQKDHLLRALTNVVFNAVEHTPAGGKVYLTGSMAAGGWQITVRDEGPGFSKAALHHATERFWRDDRARGADGHHGLGLWFAARVVQAHAGQLQVRNCASGGMVIIKLR